MDCTTLSDYQLYEIIQNANLDQAIRQLANDEFNNRKLSLDEIQGLITKYDSKFLPDKDIGLNTYYKILLVICPFFIVIHSLFAGRMLAKGQKQKWKDYWIYICLGFSTWTIGIILYAKYFLFKAD
jgi:hypothetical protein